MPKNFVGEPFSVLKTSGNEIFSCIGGRALRFFQMFCFTVPKNFVRVIVVFRKGSGMGKIWIKGRLSQFSVGVVLFHSAKRCRRGTLLLSENFVILNLFMHRGSGITILSILFGLTVPKGFVDAGPSCFRNVLV